MSDVEHAIGMIRSGRLTTDQVLLLVQSGLLRPLPNQGVKVVIVGSVAGYLDQEATFHEAVATYLIRRGIAVLAEGIS